MLTLLDRHSPAQENANCENCFGALPRSHVCISVQLRIIGSFCRPGTSLINSFGTSIIDQHVRESVKTFIISFLEQSDGIFVFFSTRFQRARGCNYGNSQTEPK